MKKPSIAKLTRQYPDRKLLEKTAPANPFRLFHHWFAEAANAKLLDPHAMALSTVSAGGKPTARMVLLKALDNKGFVFFTNYLSRKGKELHQNPAACLLFFWPELGRQIRIEGRAQKVTSKESDDYFKTRPLGSQLSAWASHQSQVVPNREVLEKKMRELGKKYHHRPVPRPPHWGGYRVLPSAIEFWSGRRNRLHDRLVYRRKGPGGWKRERLSP
ncbi:MAG TPA: pyridoxamine 5'-phosphate oxidase [bacterium]|nr:pyridoxamine 5'-phosphate oxidase [bacterium]